MHGAGRMRFEGTVWGGRGKGCLCEINKKLSAEMSFDHLPVPHTSMFVIVIGAADEGG
jgi:hypothetical protein